MKPTKTPKNTDALQALAAQNLEVHIRHYRRLENIFSREVVEVADKDLRGTCPIEMMQAGWRVSDMGGATELMLTPKGAPDIVIGVRADCWHKDRFNRRLGVAACLQKLKTKFPHIDV